MFAFTDETLYWLVEHAGSLNAGLFGDSLPDELTAIERAKVVRAATTLGDLRQRKDELLVAELLSEAISATGYDAVLLTEFLGQRKWANVQKLIEQARALDRTRPGDLHGFVTQLSEFVVRTPKEPLAATRAEGDVIRIMTIHYAKGLEFPLVVVPDLDRPNFPGARQPVFDDELGPLVPAADKKEIVGWDLHRFAEQEQDREERKRLLYVACTRAADYLLLSSSIENLQKPKSDWMKLLGEHFDLTDGSCVAELPPDYTKPAIRVTTVEPETTRTPAGPTRGADLHQLIDKTHQLAEAGKGVVPADVEPIPVDRKARKQFSFSRLSGQLRSVARFATTGEPPSDIDARGLGTLVHAVLERVDFDRSINDLQELCSFLAPQNVEDEPHLAANEATEMIGRFLSSPRAKQLATARAVHREVEFLLPWPLDDNATDGRFLHGFIDCLYLDEQSNWHLLDYKSNQVPVGGIHELAKGYAIQMFVYHHACERALGVAPVETVLHFLRPGDEVSFEWGPKDLSVFQQRVNELIAMELDRTSE